MVCIFSNQIFQFVDILEVLEMDNFDIFYDHMVPLPILAGILWSF
jgi:hypothetical protein